MEEALAGTEWGRRVLKRRPGSAQWAAGEARQSSDPPKAAASAMGEEEQNVDKQHLAAPAAVEMDVSW